VIVTDTTPLVTLFFWASLIRECDSGKEEEAGA